MAIRNKVASGVHCPSYELRNEVVDTDRRQSHDDQQRRAEIDANEQEVARHLSVRLSVSSCSGKGPHPRRREIECKGDQKGADDRWGERDSKDSMKELEKRNIDEKGETANDNVSGSRMPP